MKKRSVSKSHLQDPPQTQLFPSRELDKVVVRLPDGMREWLKSEAEKSGRSMNAEIVRRLSISQSGDTQHGALATDHTSPQNAEADKIKRELLEKELYWHNVLLAIMQEKRSQLMQFRVTLRHILSEKDFIPEKVADFCRDNLDVIENDISEFPDTLSQLEFLTKQSGRASDFVYASGDDSDDEAIPLYPSKKANEESR